MKIIDITQEVFSCRVFPGDSQPKFERALSIERDKLNLTNISMCVHNGTHIDAPNHFVAGGKAVHELDLERFYGKCAVVEKGDIISALNNCHERIIIKGDCEISEETARLIADSNVKLIGVENQSVANIESPMSVHVILLEKEIALLEGLDLSGVNAGEYVLAAFPLKLEGSDGSPVRAVLIDS
ncbi:MAG: cyclase family protein [Oscillospiraceae bacterium]|nr:cyclase family protein [Oscillospiraceae bacterium]